MLHNGLSNVDMMVKSRKVRWAGHVIRAREIRKTCRILVGNPSGNLLVERLQDEMGEQH
jgi:hypothetical protein